MADQHTQTAETAAVSADEIRRDLGARSLVLVGMMGAGKTSVGKRLASALRLPFVDADSEIEKAANRTISEIFAEYGEGHFRTGERRVIARLLRSGPQVLATGGGSFMNATTRRAIAERGISIWLKADLSVLMERVRRKSSRPLLQTPDPEGTLRALINERYPVYAKADLVVESRDVPHMIVVSQILSALKTHFDGTGTGAPS